MSLWTPTTSRRAIIDPMILIRSDARQLPLADESVQCCVTSPPYWGLRSYQGGENMIGLEPTFDEHLANLVAVFREVRRVLRKDGTCWLNYGDAYAGSWGDYRPTGTGGQRSKSTDRWERAGSLPTTMLPPACNAKKQGLKPKDLMLMPARVALALQADGWWVRSEIIWHKPNPMPESVTDRPTNAHEKVFLLTKATRYFYDAEAVRHQKSLDTIARDNRSSYYEAHTPPESSNHSGLKDRGAHPPTTANLRNVWTIPTQGVSAAHFATFPEKLIEPCILAGTSAEGACAKCGAPWERVVIKVFERATDRSEERTIRESGTEKENPDWGWKGSQRGSTITSTLSWKPTCECEAERVPCTVLDPFVGSGTTLRVATRLNRRGIGCDLGYQDIAVKRTTNVQRILAIN